MLNELAMCLTTNPKREQSKKKKALAKILTIKEVSTVTGSGAHLYKKLQQFSTKLKRKVFTHILANNPQKQIVLQYLLKATIGADLLMGLLFSKRSEVLVVRYIVQIQRKATTPDNANAVQQKLQEKSASMSFAISSSQLSFSDSLMEFMMRFLSLFWKLLAYFYLGRYPSTPILILSTMFSSLQQSQRLKQLQTTTVTSFMSAKTKLNVNLAVTQKKYCSKQLPKHQSFWRGSMMQKKMIGINSSERRQQKVKQLLSELSLNQSGGFLIKIISRTMNPQNFILKTSPMKKYIEQDIIADRLNTLYLQAQSASKIWRWNFLQPQKMQANMIIKMLSMRMQMKLFTIDKIPYSSLNSFISSVRGFRTYGPRKCFKKTLYCLLSSYYILNLYYSCSIKRVKMPKLTANNAVSI